MEHHGALVHQTDTETGRHGETGRQGDRERKGETGRDRGKA